MMCRNVRNCEVLDLTESQVKSITFQISSVHILFNRTHICYIRQLIGWHLSDSQVSSLGSPETTLEYIHHVNRKC